MCGDDIDDEAEPAWLLRELESALGLTFRVCQRFPGGEQVVFRVVRLYPAKVTSPACSRVECAAH